MFKGRPKRNVSTGQKPSSLNVCHAHYLYRFTVALYITRCRHKSLVTWDFVNCFLLLFFYPPLARYISNCGVLDINYFNNKSLEGNSKTRANKWIICKVSPHANRERGRATVPDASAYATVQVWSQLLGSWTPPPPALPLSLTMTGRWGAHALRRLQVRNCSGVCYSECHKGTERWTYGSWSVGEKKWEKKVAPVR